MTKSETARLMGLIAAYDQRTVGESDIEAWHAVASYAGWNFDGARRAVIVHYSSSVRRIMPGHVSEFLRNPEESGRRICEY